ncbi:MAG TPA: hypothetical protein VGA67_02810 [Candidatus Dojkabacteria bacterium]
MLNLDQNTVLEMIQLEVEEVLSILRGDPQLVAKLRLDFRASNALSEAIEQLNRGDLEDSYHSIAKVMDFLFT